MIVIKLNKYKKIFASTLSFLFQCEVDKSFTLNEIQQEKSSHFVNSDRFIHRNNDINISEHVQEHYALFPIKYIVHSYK